MINILTLRKQLLEKYKSYTSSFLNIQDERLSAFAHQKLDEDYLWAEPLLQCNPGFEKGESLNELVNGHGLHPEMKKIFKGFQLYKHQTEAIKTAMKGKGFIVTSGTGSGKSLTYIGSIFNKVLHLPESERKGVKAIIVYPMNALINSQEEAMMDLKEKYEKENGEGSFPITFQKYTGQESDEQKKKAIENPPNIILTNYMMLELLLTRSKEAELRDSICKELEFLVFDELHWYRGRQGADVALLIRRIKARAQKEILCMGTSATLSSGSLSQQNKDVGYLGKQLFDEDFESTQIIGETLKCLVSEEAQQSDMRHLLNQPLEKPENILTHPLSYWMERNVALKQQEGVWIRGEARTIDNISAKLAVAAQVSEETAEKRLTEFLELLQEHNTHEKDEFLPFRVHQFITQTIPLKVSLETPKNRLIECRDEHHVLRNNEQIPLYPVHFNHQSGFPYLKVSLQSGEVVPDYDEMDEANEETEKGYILMDDEQGESIWNPNEQMDILPDSWIDIKDNQTKLKKGKEKLLPRSVYVHVNGLYSFEPRENYAKAWFVSKPLRFDPLSCIVYEPMAREKHKLYQIGEAGRSMSTTILSYSVLQQLKENGVDPEVQKIMSFTDSRQDAALQAGHFNDFMRHAFIRSAIYKALEKHSKLDHSNIYVEAFNEMKLREEDFAKYAGNSLAQTKANQQVFKEWLCNHIFRDLERGWRYDMPNLEQTASIEIQYNGLKEECDDDTGWEKSPFLSFLNAEQRYLFLMQFLNFFRSSYALDHNKLTSDSLEINGNRMKQKLKVSWLYRENENLKEPFWMRVDKLNSKKVYTKSISGQSAFGKYFKFFAKQREYAPEKVDWKKETESMLFCLTKAGFLVENRTFSISLYRLRLETICWTLGDGENMILDEVRSRSVKGRKVKPNPYFNALYQISPLELKQMVAQEHTGQVLAEDRQQIEKDFREAKTQALYCSPTMELGIDINELSVVHLRNVPPNPSSYAQRSGRAGRKGQGALILSFCSKKSPHDQHFFRNKMDMISGKVIPQKLDLTHPDLLRSHLQAIYLAECELSNLNQSLFEILEIEEARLPLKESIQKQLELSPEKKEDLVHHFEKVIEGLKSEPTLKSWYTPNWIKEQIDQAAESFNSACNRWRELYHQADQSKKSATSILELAHLTKNSPQWEEADKQMHHAQRKLDLLRNKTTGRDFSEFYPYRYLASEGFLPGYNFTRLPIRIFLSGKDRDNGTYLSRPRFLALNEFGPGNIIYQRGHKWKVTTMQLPSSKTKLTLEQASLDKKSGFMLLGDDSLSDINPFTGKSNRGKDNSDIVSNLCNLQDMVGVDHERISCYEDERQKMGYDQELHFSYPGDLNRCKKLGVYAQERHLLNLHFLPVAQLVKISNQWKQSTNKEGFRIDQKTGRWITEKQYKEIKERSKKSKDAEEAHNIKQVKLYTTVTADCLYLEPLKNLQLERSGVISLMYALKNALEEQFQVESQEIQCELMGEPQNPNILFYEAAEGSLGVLSRLTDKLEFKKWVHKAFTICGFDDPEKEAVKASYGDLLSYYNQRYHHEIDRFSIKGALQYLIDAQLQSPETDYKDPYDRYYENLLAQISNEEPRKKELLTYLYKNKIKLPDKLNHKPSGIPEAFDFFYEDSDLGIQIEGEAPSTLEDHALKVMKISRIQWFRDQPLPDLIKEHASFFTSLKNT